MFKRTVLMAIICFNVKNAIVCIAKIGLLLSKKTKLECYLRTCDTRLPYSYSLNYLSNNYNAFISPLASTDLLI